MRQEQVRRLVVASAYPLVGHRPRVVLAILRAVFALPYADARAVEELVTNSHLDWTLVRLNRLLDRDPVGSPIVSTELLDHPTP